MQETCCILLYSIFEYQAWFVASCSPRSTAITTSCKGGGFTGSGFPLQRLQHHAARRHGVLIEAWPLCVMCQG